MDVKNAIMKAEELVEKFNSQGLVPFPFAKLEEAFGDLKIMMVDMPYETISGAIMFEREKEIYRILVNRDKPETRIYFTIAHELGHYFLHGDYLKNVRGFIDEDGNLDIMSSPLFRDDKGENSEMEAAANNFAASLIMPRKLVKKAWDELGDIERCAKIFKVSVSAMSIRLEKLNLINHEVHGKR